MRVMLIPMVSYGEWPHFVGMLFIFMTLYALFGHIPDMMERRHWEREQERRRHGKGDTDA